MGVESVWRHRLRWRMRGAYQWPAFGLLTAIDTVIMLVLPFYGQGPDGLGALLLAGFLNLGLVALIAPLLGLLVRARRPDLPRLVANDYAGTWLMALATAVLIAAGIAHRPARAGREDAERRVAAAMRHYIATEAPQLRSRAGMVDAVALGNDLYRACVPGADAQHAHCLFVRTSQRPAGITVDTDETPNRLWRGR